MTDSKPRVVTDTPPPKAASRSWIDVALIALVFATVIAITAFVVNHFAQSATDAATILGIVIPALATIGAAIFGVSVAYSAGQTTGEAKGAANVELAVSDAAARTASSFKEGIRNASDALSSLHQDLHTHTVSPPGSQSLMFAYRPLGRRTDEYEAGAEIDPAPLEEARRQLDRLQGIVDALS